MMCERTMPSSMVLRRHVNDMIQCPICLDVFDTPTSLPCLHTFCLRCLQTTFSGDCVGDVASCPVCRGDFRLPASGLASLPKNFTLGSLAALCSAASVSAVSRARPSYENRDAEDDGMSSDAESKVDEEGLTTAETSRGSVVVDCSDDRQRSSSAPPPVAHTQHDIRLTTSSLRHCDKHTASGRVEFCFDCRVDVCMTCCAGDHRQHRRRRLSEVTGECQRRAGVEVARVTEALNATYLAVNDVDRRRMDVLSELQRKEGLIREECDADDRDEVERRLNALAAEKDDALRQVVACREHLEMDQTSLETFLKDSAVRMVTATTTDGLLRVVRQLKTEANALLGIHQQRLDKTMQQTSWTVVAQTAASEKPVCALTVLDNELYLARSGSHDIDVFDVRTFTECRRLTVTCSSLFRRHAVTDMTSCPRHRCLYVADGCGRVVRRLDRSDGRKVTGWSVDGGRCPTGLSMTSAFNVVVACSDSLSLCVYTPLGCPVCEISVEHPGLVGLLHGVQTDTGSFVAIGLTESGDRLACLCRDGADVPDLIDCRGSPAHMAPVRGQPGCSSYVWLAEREVNAGIRLIQVPSPSRRSVSSIRRAELEEPDKVCWDDSTQCLYAVDHGHVKVLRVQMKCDLY